LRANYLPRRQIKDWTVGAGAGRRRRCGPTRRADHDAPGTIGRKPGALVHAVVCHEAEASNWPAADIGNLCHGLDALCRLFRIGGDSS